MAIQAARCSGTDTDKACCTTACARPTPARSPHGCFLLCQCCSRRRSRVLCVCVQIMSALARLLPRAAFGQLHYRRGAVSRHTSRTLARAWEA